MRHFSGGYLPINLNFVISDITFSKKIDEKTKAAVSVLENILFRGSPAKPSNFLKNSLGNIEPYGLFKYFNKGNDLKWSNTIKGFYSNNPASDFYESLKKRLGNEWFWFLPECNFRNLTRNPLWPKDSAVDFYSPAHRTVIEIDGSQHSRKLEHSIDLNRDKELSNSGIKNILRLKPDLNDDDLNEVALYLHKIYEEEKAALKLRNVFIVSGLTPREYSYVYAFRFQIVLLSLIKNGFLINKNKCDIEVKNRNFLTEEALNVALADLKEHYRNLTVLMGIENSFEVGKISIVDEFSSNGIHIDMAADSLYDETIDSNINNVICIRNDYFFYAGKNITMPRQTLGVFPDYYPQFKNYLRIENEGKFDYSNLDSSNDNQTNSLAYFLKLIFGYSSFRPKQKDIIVQGLKRECGVIGLLPTGSGKSICFQLVSFLVPGETIVISPLSLLMQDQCDNLYKRNQISVAYYINATDIGRQSLSFFIQSQSKITYISPERFFNKEFAAEFISHAKYVSQIVVDEVHCLSEWGHDFRTSYLLLFNFLKNKGITEKSLLMGTSATASPRVIFDIIKEFKKMKSDVVVVRGTSVKRPELTFRKIDYQDEEDKCSRIAELAKNNAKNNSKTVIFVPFKRDTWQLGALLRDIDVVRVDTCTGDDSGEKKRHLLLDFSSGITNTIVATKAFGMGLDIPDIRETIHTDLSSSVESAYQEMGRAGRDKKQSVCTLLYLKNESAEEKINELFKSDLSLNDLTSLAKYGPLYKQLVLIKSSNDDPNDEAYYINIFYTFLKVSGNSFSSSQAFETINSIVRLPSKFYKTVVDENGKRSQMRDLDYMSMFIEKSLYKLYLLGVVGLWGKSFRSSLEDPIFMDILLKEKTIEEIRNNLENYILQYDAFADISIESLKDALKALCQWSYDNFFKSRWNSLRTLHDMVSGFTNSEDFAEKIDLYFSENRLIDQAVLNPNDPKLWIETIQSNEPSLLIRQLPRYIEDYPNNLAIDVITSIVYLLNDKFDDRNGTGKFKLALKAMNETNDQQIISSFICGLKTLIDKDKMINILSEILDNSPEWIEQSYCDELIEKMDENGKEIFKDRREKTLLYQSMKNMLAKMEKKL